MAKSKQSSRSGRRRRSRGRRGPQGQGPQADVPEEKPQPPKSYALARYDTLVAATAELEKIRDDARNVDQFNVAIRAEGIDEENVLAEISNVRVYSGNAWATVHERRLEEGWYDELH